MDLSKVTDRTISTNGGVALSAAEQGTFSNEYVYSNALALQLHVPVSPFPFPTLQTVLAPLPR